MQLKSIKGPYVDFHVTFKLKLLEINFLKSD